MAFKDKEIFIITPAPSEQNTSKIQWRGFLDDLNEDIVIFDDVTNSVLFTIGGGGGVLPVTYAELTTLIANSALTPGRQYLITDFATKFIIPNTIQEVTGATEPIIVKAANSSELNSSAISTVFSEDELLYEVVDSTTSGGDKGRIYYRRDTEIQVSSWYDWRVVQFRRWDDGVGNFTVLTDNGNAFQDFYTFNNSASASNCFTTSLGPITQYGITTFGAPTSKLNNFIISATCVDSIIQNDCFSNTVICTSFSVNRIFEVFAANIVLGGDFSSNTLGFAFIANTIGSGFVNNLISTLFFGNALGDNFSQNRIGINFIGNTIGNAFQRNTIAAVFSSNIIGNSFASNTIGATCTGNSIGNTFSSNRLSINFRNNVIANGFTGNTIRNGFTGNTNIGDNFRMTTVTSGLVSVNFAAATFVYTNYTKNILEIVVGFID